jgi:hypothetical protein
MKAMVLYKRRHWVSTREISWPIQIEVSGLIQAFTRKAVGQYKPVDGKKRQWDSTREGSWPVQGKGNWPGQGKALGQYKRSLLASSRSDSMKKGRQWTSTRKGSGPVQEKAVDQKKRRQWVSTREGSGPE